MPGIGSKEPSASGLSLMTVALHTRSAARASSSSEAGGATKLALADEVAKTRVAKRIRIQRVLEGCTLCRPLLLGGIQEHHATAILNRWLFPGIQRGGGGSK